MTPVGCDAGPMHVSSKHMAEDIRKEYAARRMPGSFSLSPCRAAPLVGQQQGLCHSRQGKRIAGCNMKARAMGCEPTQFAHSSQCQLLA